MAKYYRVRAANRPNLILANCGSDEAANATVQPPPNEAAIDRFFVYPSKNVGEAETEIAVHLEGAARDNADRESQDPACEPD
jgi:hypothetical protein